MLAAWANQFESRKNHRDTPSPHHPISLTVEADHGHNTHCPHKTSREDVSLKLGDAPEWIACLFPLNRAPARGAIQSNRQAETRELKAVAH